MAYRMFMIPAAHSDYAVDELNQFLASNQVLDVDERFHVQDGRAFWLFRVTHVPAVKSAAAGKSVAGKIDYKEVLSDEDFAIFAQLRELRKQISEELSVPLFAVFSNEQLAEMARRRIASLSDLRPIGGVGDKKVENFGDRFVEVVTRAVAAMNGDSSPA